MRCSDSSIASGAPPRTATDVDVGMLNIETRVESVSSKDRQRVDSNLWIETCLVKPLTRAKIHSKRPVNEHRRQHETDLRESPTGHSRPPGRCGQHRHSSIDELVGGHDVRPRGDEIRVPECAVEVRGHQADHQVIIGRGETGALIGGAGHQEGQVAAQ
jgi:hypothetical protein